MYQGVGIWSFFKYKLYWDVCNATHPFINTTHPFILLGAINAVHLYVFW